MSGATGDHSSESAAVTSIAPVGRAAVRLSYGGRVRRRRSGRPASLTFLGYFGSIVAVGLLTMQTINVIQGIVLLIRPRVRLMRPWHGQFVVAMGLAGWQILLLIGLSLLAIFVSSILLVGAVGLLRLRAAALARLQRYALWQFATVMLSVAGVVSFAGEIAACDYGEITPNSVGLVYQWSLIQAGLAVIWSIIVLRVVTLPGAYKFWEGIDEDARVPVARIAEPSPTSRGLFRRRKLDFK